jgi:hypothetical protein
MTVTENLKFQVEKICFDVKGMGSVCTKTCFSRMAMIAAHVPAVCANQKACPTKWK